MLTLPLLLMAVAACGGDDDADAPASTAGATIEATVSADVDPTAMPDEDVNGDEAQPPAGEGDDALQVNDESLAVSDVRRCEPFSDEEGNLDLTVIGDGVMLFVTVNQSGTSLSHEMSLQGSSAGGVFAAIASESADGSWVADDGALLPGPPFTVTGDRISGAMILNDAQGGSETAYAGFDVAIPAEIIDCSL